MTVTIYHNPDCGTSRNTLGLIRNAGIEPQVIEYLRTPPDRATLLSLIAAMGAQNPAALDRAHTVTYLKDAILQRLTGVRVTDASDTSLPFLDTRTVLTVL